MTSTGVELYFEESWAILSSIGIGNTGFGLMIAGITSLSHISIVPIVVSVAGAIANGLCYYAFYSNHSTSREVVAAAIADITWLIQEAGLSFYSYLILTRVLRRRDRVIFMSLFWSLIGIISGLRVGILACRNRQILAEDTHLQMLINHLHIGYFSSIAAIEIVSAVFLLRKFAAARKASMEVAIKSTLFRYLMRSTEIRLAALAVIGITRAVTYSFQATAQSATTTAGQIDRFVYTLECLFPMVMYIDILASKLTTANYIHESSSQSRGYTRSGQRQGGIANGRGDNAMYSMNHIETRVEAHHQPTSSQERIIDASAPSRQETRESEGSGEMDSKSGVISKTVEFDFHVSSV